MAGDKKRRKKRKGVPPILTVEQAISVAQQIYKTTGGQPITHDDLASILGNVKTSGIFTQKLIALRAYGLLSRSEENGEASCLSELATRLFSATSEDEENAIRLEIFRNPQPYAILHDSYAGQLIPETKYLVNVLEKQSDVSLDFREEWAKRFESEGRYASVIYEDVRGRQAVRRTPGPLLASEQKREEGKLPPPLAPMIKPPEGDSPKEQEYKIPTPSGLIRLYVPKECAAEDLEVAKGLLELIINRLSKDKTTH